MPSDDASSSTNPASPSVFKSTQSPDLADSLREASLREASRRERNIQQANSRIASRYQAQTQDSTASEAVLDTEMLLDAAGSLIVVFNRQGKIKRFNRTCEVTTGYTEKEVQGHCVWDFLLIPEERIAMQGVFRRLINGQTNSYYESTWLGKGYEKHVIAWSNTVLTNPLGEVDFIVASGIEVTEQRRSRRQLEGQYRHSHLLAEITRKVRQSLELKEILQTTVSEVQGLLGCDHVFILQAPPMPSQVPGQVPSQVPGQVPSQTPGQQQIRLAAEALTDFAQGPSQSLLHRPWPHNPLLQPGYVDHYRQQSISVTDTMGGPGVAPEIADILDQLAVKSELAVPILTGGPSEASDGDPDSKEKFWGLLVAHQCFQSRRWSPLEIDLMQQLANQIGVAIDHAQLLEHLEDIVVERTAKLTRTNQQLRREMDERIRTEGALRRSENQLRLITNALPALVAYIDIYHRYRFNNYAYETWYDIPYQQIKGRQVSDIVSMSVYQQMLPYLEEALTGKKVTYEAEMIQSSGDRLWTSISYIPDIQEGVVKGLFSLVSDISDRKAAEQMKDEFVSVASHELRTPLTSIHGSLKLLATGRLGELTQQGQELVNIAIKNTDRLTRLINDVLDLERMGSGQVAIAPIRCRVSELLYNATEAMQPMADEYNIHISVRIAQDAAKDNAENAYVLAAPDQVMQALTNLLSNAIKFSPKGSTVSVGARSLNSKIEFFVKDTGRGIPGNKLETIFERFQQVDSSDARERGGTGLGLAICREIIQQHQGRIWVRSIHGQGSTFYFTLPKP
ncbi:MAG: ATP-binding protein [Cyanobacteria bacterium J06634_6]